MASNEQQAKILRYLIEVEKVGHDIVTDRREVVMLEKKRNEHREAIRALKNSVQSQCYVSVGAVLVKNNVELAMSLLEADQKQLNNDISKIREEIKVKVNKLRDLEMLPPVPGMSLVPMSENERLAFI